MEPGKTLFKGFVVQADRGFKRGVAPALVLVERADAIHVGFHISTWRKDQADTSTSTIIIQITARDRDLRLQGNVVEPRFPMIDIFAGAGWSHGQQQFIGFLETLNHLCNRSVRGLAVDRDSAQLVEECAERPLEERMFAHPGNSHPHDIRCGEHEDEIPITRMRCTDQDEFPSGWKMVFHAPSEGTHPDPTHPIAEFAVWCSLDQRPFEVAICQYMLLWRSLFGLGRLPVRSTKCTAFQAHVRCRTHRIDARDRFFPAVFDSQPKACLEYSRGVGKINYRAQPGLGPT